MIAGAQIRQVRELLGRSQYMLAFKAGGIALSTLKRVEGTEGLPEITRTQACAIRASLEAAGVEFTNGDRPGARLVDPATVTVVAPILRKKGGREKREVVAEKARLRAQAQERLRAEQSVEASALAKRTSELRVRRLEREAAERDSSPKLKRAGPADQGTEVCDLTSVNDS